MRKKNSIFFILIVLFALLCVQGKSFAYSEVFESMFIKDDCRVESVYGADGSFIYYYYTAAGRFDRSEQGLKQHGVSQVQYFYYDSQGNIDRIESEHEHRKDYVFNFIYDSEGKLVEKEHTPYSDDNNITDIEFFYYDSSGRLTRTEVFDVTDMENPDIVEYFYYDDAGRLERFETDRRGDGNIDDIAILHYDSDGKVTKFEYPMYNEALTLNWNCDFGIIPDEENEEEEIGTPEDKNGEDETDPIDDENGEEGEDEGGSSSSGCFIGALK